MSVGRFLHMLFHPHCGSPDAHLAKLFDAHRASSARLVEATRAATRESDTKREKVEEARVYIRASTAEGAESHPLPRTSETRRNVEEMLARRDARESSAGSGRE